MSRHQNESYIRDVMYGAPGEPQDSEIGRMLMLQIIGQMGLSALTDEAVRQLAQAHQMQDEIEARKALRRYAP